jgi:hypothetical protein
MRLAKLIAAAAILCAACGDSPGGPGNGDAGIDAPAAAPYDGLWRLTSATFGSDAGTITMTDQNQLLTDPENGEMHLFRINGTLEVGGGEIAYVQQRVIDDAIPLARTPQIANFVTHVTASGGTFALTGYPGVGFVFTPPPDEKLEIDLDAQNKLELRRTVHAASETLSVRGRITLAAGTPTFTSPHVSIAFLLRGGTFGVDPRDDQLLDFTGTDNVTFALDRTEGALGTQRIVFGDPNTAIAVGLVIVWDDVDGNGAPSATLLDKCTLPAPPGSDCLRGVSPIYIAYRSGSSPELAASPYAHVRAGWTQNLFIQDLRGQFARNGMVSLDATRGVPFDVYVPPSPMQTFVPAFDF